MFVHCTFPKSAFFRGRFEVRATFEVREVQQQKKVFFLNRQTVQDEASESASAPPWDMT